METKTTLLKETVTEEILNNQRLQTRLQLAFGKTYFSIRRWAQTNNVILTSATALLIISEETGQNIADLLDE